jgi:hypothetical protein
MKKFGELKVGDLIATIHYQQIDNDWRLITTESEIVKINKRKRIFELTSGRNMYVDSMMDVCEICWDFIICPNDEQNVVFAQKMLSVGMNMHRKKTYSDLQKFLISCGACYDCGGDLKIHR